MKIKFVILPTGELSFYTQEGTFADGAAKIGALLAELKAKGFKIANEGTPEQHRHDDLGVHARTHADTAA